jgi:hypothetical protein
VHWSSHVFRNEPAPLFNHRLYNNLPLLPDTWSTLNSGEWEYLLVHRSACTIRRCHNCQFDEQSHLQPVHSLCNNLFAAVVESLAELLVLVMLLSDFFTFGKLGSRYCAFTNRSANSKCTSLSRRWQYGPALPSLTRLCMKLTPVFLSSSMPLGQLPRTTYSFLHRVFHSPIRLSGSIDRPTLSCTLSGGFGSKNGV